MSKVVFTDNSDQLFSDFDHALSRALTAIGMTAEGYAKKETPVDTGRLRNSISHKEIKKSAYIGSNVEYAPYIELGTIKISPYHMLKRAASEHGDEYKKIIISAMKNA